MFLHDWFDVLLCLLDGDRAGAMFGDEWVELRPEWFCWCLLLPGFNWWKPLATFIRWVLL